jgi:hypothetical protein
VQERKVKYGWIEQTAELVNENKRKLTTSQVVSSSAGESGFHRVDRMRMSGRDVASERELLLFAELRPEKVACTGQVNQKKASDNRLLMRNR